MIDIDVVVNSVDQKVHVAYLFMQQNAGTPYYYL